MKFAILRRDSIACVDGISAFIFALSDALIEAGHEVFIVSAAGDVEEVKKNFGPYRFTRIYSIFESLPEHRKLLAGWRKKGLALLRNIEPNFVISNGALPFKIPYPSCVLSHDLERRWQYGSFLNRLYKMYAYRQTDRVLATCTELKRALSAELKMPEASISVIPTCIDLTGYRSEPYERREAAILHMGMPWYKNPAASIRAFAQLTTPVKLYITGKPTPEVEELVASLPKEKRVNIHLVGIVSSAELRRLLSVVRLLSVPSDYAVPVASPTVLDGFASGTPVIGTSGISGDLIVDGVSGYRLSPKKFGDLADKMQLLLSDEAAWRTANKAALDRAANFDNHRIAAAYVQLARETIANRTSMRK